MKDSWPELPRVNLGIQARNLSFPFSRGREIWSEMLILYVVNSLWDPKVEKVSVMLNQTWPIRTSTILSGEGYSLNPNCSIFQTF